MPKIMAVGERTLRAENPRAIRGFRKATHTERLLVPVAKQQRAVGSAETKRIRHGVFEAGFSRLIGNQIHPGGIGVGIFQIDGRRQYLIAQCKNGDARFQPARAAQQVSGHRLGRTDSKFVIPEEIPDGMRFERVADRS